MLLACSGITYAWFSQRAALSTLMNIIPPDSITIIPIDSQTGQAMTLLDLDFKEGADTKDEETGTITIRRPVCIKSTSPVHQLEVVHTTNLNGLSFEIYKTTLDAQGKIIVPNFTDTDNPPNNIRGEYKNETTEGSKLAKPEPLNNYDVRTVEAHAYPLYWLAGNCGDSEYVAESDKSKISVDVESERTTEFDSAKQENKVYFSTYYFLEITWQETTKETDLFYIMAQNIAVNTKNPDEGGGNS